MKIKGIVLMLICTVFTAFGQFFFKKGTSGLEFSTLLTNYNLMLGFFLYGLGAVLMLYALKFGELSALYPIISLTFVWVTVLSIVYLEEQLSGLQYLGIGSILAGVFLISKGGKNDII